MSKVDSSSIDGGVEGVIGPASARGEVCCCNLAVRGPLEEGELCKVYELRLDVGF